MGDNFPVRNVFIAILLLLGFFGYWFYSASTYASGNDLHTANRTFLPATCSIATDPDDDVHEKAEAYFMGSKVRIATHENKEGTAITKSEVTDGDQTFAWIDGESQGEIAPRETTYTDLTDIARGHSWSCRPWISINTEKFMLPRGVKFVPAGSAPVARP